MRCCCLMPASTVCCAGPASPLACAVVPQLVRSFCDGTSLRPPPVDGRVPGTNRGCFTDEAWVAAWRAFHRRNARRLELRCIPCAQQLAQQDGGGQGWRAASASAS